MVAKGRRRDMRKLIISTPTAVHGAVLSTLLIATGAYANEVVSHSASPGPASQISPADAAGAQAPQGRILTSPTQLTEKVRSVLRLPNSDVAPEAFGEGKHPFTTVRASADKDPTPTDKYPWSPTGKLFMKFGNATFVCTASVIRKGLLVTAAHCVHNFGEGEGGFADSIEFQPALYESSMPFGKWTGKQWWIPKVYFDGTDVCSTEAPGVVCENDVAVIVVEPATDGKLIGDVSGMYDFKDGEFGYPIFLGEKATEFTQLGYPSANYDGDKMVRTDSLGYQDDPNNVVIGSNQTGGSSGGPWLQNFGTETDDFTGTKPTDADPNQVTATTSWGFTLGTIKVQGASRFATNTAFTIKSNIETLVEAACAANPGSC
jgi:V8-like Glu-specific endopeptidase